MCSLPFLTITLSSQDELEELQSTLEEKEAALSQANSGLETAQAEAATAAKVGRAGDAGAGVGTARRVQPMHRAQTICHDCCDQGSPALSECLP